MGGWVLPIVGFSRKQLLASLLLPGWDVRLILGSPDIFARFPIKRFAVTKLYTWVERHNINEVS